MKLSEEVALSLLQINAIRLSPQNPFTWASGLKSPIYCDNRMILSFPEIRKQIIEAFKQRSAEFDNFYGVAGVATAGIAHGALLAEALDKPFIYVRSKKKEHGRQNQIEGRAEEGKSYLVIEDLISTGGSCLAAVEALRAAGCTVAGVMAIFQYNFLQARERFAKAECTFKTLSDYEALVQVAADQHLFETHDIALLRSWHTDPHNWTPEQTLERH